MKAVALILLLSGIAMLIGGAAWYAAIVTGKVRATDLPVVMLMVGVFDLVAWLMIRKKV